MQLLVVFLGILSFFGAYLSFFRVGSFFDVRIHTKKQARIQTLKAIAYLGYSAFWYITVPIRWTYLKIKWYRSLQ